MCEKNDPFRHVYDEIERKEVYVSILFYVTTALSCLATFRDKLSSTFPLISSFDYDHWVPIAITLTSLSGFLLSLFIREYSFPNSEEKRLKDNLANASCASFGQEKTVGYYNNHFQNPDLKNAANTLENLFFTKAILSSMIARKTLFLFCYIVIAVYFALIADIPNFVIAFQFLISEPILSNWIKTCVLLYDCNRIYDFLVGIFKGNPDIVFRCKSIFSFTAYEMAKARAGIVLPSKIFEKMNPKLSAQWQKIIAELRENVEDMH